MKYIQDTKEWMEAEKRAVATFEAEVKQIPSLRHWVKKACLKRGRGGAGKARGAVDYRYYRISELLKTGVSKKGLDNGSSYTNVI